MSSSEAAGGFPRCLRPVLEPEGVAGAEERGVEELPRSGRLPVEVTEAAGDPEVTAGGRLGSAVSPGSGGGSGAVESRRVVAADWIGALGPAASLAPPLLLIPGFLHGGVRGWK